MVAYLARQLQQSHTVALLCGPEATGHASWNGLDVYQIHSEYHPRLRPALSLANPSTARGVAGALRAFRPDVVHAWKFITTWATSRYGLHQRLHRSFTRHRML